VNVVGGEGINVIGPVAGALFALEQNESFKNCRKEVTAHRSQKTELCIYLK